MKKIYLTLLLSFLIATSIIAQQKSGVMSFNVQKHDYGNITQKDGPAKFTFEFTNTGGTPITITNVKSSCGCTTPEWTKSPVAPGAKGFVDAIYDPRNRPGHFSKSITVTSNASNSPITLSITGNVAEKQNTISQSYPQEVGKLKVDQIYLNFGNTFSDESGKEMQIKMYNPTKEDLTVIVEDRYKPAYVTISVEPEVLKPEQEGVIKMTYDATKVNDWDYVRGFVYLTVNGARITNKRLQVSAVIKERFTDKQFKNPPVIEFEETEFNFDTINENDVIVHEFTYKNTGKDDLIIRKTKTSCGCTAVSLSKDPIKPGQSGTIKATFNSAHKKNRQVKTITIITNCPEQKYNKVVLKISGYVIPKQ